MSVSNPDSDPDGGVSELRLKVKASSPETPDICRVELVAADGGPLPAFDAGAHIDLALAKGVVRQYSLCNGPDDAGGYTIAVKLEAESRGGSRAVHALTAGQEIGGAGPRNLFPLDRAEEHFVLLAGGIGVTPLLSMARHLHAEGRSFALHYFTRDLGHTAFARELGAGPYAKHVTLHMGLDADQTCATLDTILQGQPSGTGVYICGPRPFIEAAKARAVAAVGEQAVHIEYFAADDALLAKPQDAFVVRLASDGRELEVPAGTSILDVLAQNGVFVEMMCQQGVCGTCITGVIDGIPDHRDSYLTDAEKRDNKLIMPCCSRALSPVLVLDL